MELHLDSYSREDIRDLYNAAHDAQLRLSKLRSQAELLQSRHHLIKEHQRKIRWLIDLLSLQSATRDDPSALKPRREPTARPSLEGHEETTTVLNVIEAQEDERRRIARQIQDGPTHALTNLILRAEICERLIDRDIDEARRELSELRVMINASLQETRRIMLDLRPMMLDELGLVPTLRRYMSELAKLKDIQFSVTGPEHRAGVTGPIQVALFRMVQSILAAILAEGSADQINIGIDRSETNTKLHVDASALETDREVVNERLREPHFQHRLQLLRARMNPESWSDHGISIDIVVPALDPA